MTLRSESYYLRRAMSYVTLNKVEIAVLKNAVRRGDPDPGFQDLLVVLDSQLDENSGEMHVSELSRELLQRYSASKLSWHGILFSILGRTMSDAVSRKRG